MIEKYYNFTELVNFIDEPNKSICIRLYRENEIIMKEAKGSKTKHQFWQGGYMEHVIETMNIAVLIYKSLEKCRKLPFSLSDALLVLFLHDLEKPWKYSKRLSDVEEYRSFKNSDDFKKFIIEKYSFEINEEIWKGLKHVHGESDNEYDPYIKIQSPLSAFAHICDNISARIWFDFPKKENEW